jgi:integrase
MLPKGWFQRHGAYYYRIPRAMVQRVGKTQFRLGKTYSEALRKYAELLDGEINSDTMMDLFSRYQHEVTVQKSDATQKNERNQFIRLIAYFGEMKPSHIEQSDIYEYLDIRRKAPVAANREIALLSNVFTKMKRWGIKIENPCLGIEKHKEKPRDRYVHDEELALFYEKYCSPMLQAYIKVKYITGQRQRDVLDIRLSDITDNGIFFTNGKTKKRFLMEFSTELQEAIDQAKSIKRKVGTMYLFATRTGSPYTSDGFRSIWQRRMNKFVAAGNQRFTEHDIRAKTASDTDAAHANEIMRHNSIAFTERVYRRKLATVRPLR